MSDWFGVAPVDALPPGERQVVDVDGVNVLVVNLGGEFFAIEDNCPHDHLPISDGTIEGDEITCPFHGAKFCLKNGEVKAPPAYENIASLPVRVENGIVQVRDNRWD